MESLYIGEYDAFCRWHRVGAGQETVLYLPGLSIPAVWNFLDVATHPALGGTTGLMLDFIGSGDSDPSPWFPGTLDAHARVVAAVLDHLGCGACAVVGHSLGGSIGIQLAITRPDLVTRLVVAEGNVTPGGGGTSARIAAMSREAFVEDGLPRMLDRLRAAAIGGDRLAAVIYGGRRPADPGVLHATARALVDLPGGFAEAFLGLNLPRAFIYGERNLPDGPETATADAPDPRWLRDHGVTTHVVADAGHLLMLENLDGFVAALGEAGVPGA